MTSKSVVPVILCGGSGTRLWPLSRESFPKQFLSVVSDDKKSLLQKTISRISNLENIQSPILICNEEHRFIVAEQMREEKFLNPKIILEPFGKNTAPAITIAALKALENGDDNQILLVMASDHEIKDTDRFLKVIKEAIYFAEMDKLVTFGIIPNAPKVGYGYIKAERSFKSNKIEGIPIKSFLEKPKLDKAKEFIKDKSYTWNSGIFMFKAKLILEEINNYNPEILEACKKSLKKSSIDLDFQRINKDYFAKCKNISIDVCVMEKTKKGIVLPLNAGWSDIGSWDSVWELQQKNKDGNYKRGETILENVKNSYFRSESRLLVGVDVENLIVVETSDAVLVLNKKNSEKIKNIVNNLKKANIPQGFSNRKVFRPWGYYLTLNEGPRWHVKIIQVKAGEKLSLQMHHHRSEHWVVVSGTAKVEIDDKIKFLSENESIYIPLGSRHRLSNPGKIQLNLIEVQSGAYIGEDDIVRFLDKYGRGS